MAKAVRGYLCKETESVIVECAEGTVYEFMSECYPNLGEDMVNYLELCHADGGLQHFLDAKEAGKYETIILVDEEENV